MPTLKIAMLTAGGLAPCLSAAVGGLIARSAADRQGARPPAVSMAIFRVGMVGLRVSDAKPIVRTRGAQPCLP
jgi:pyrophosphate--fructose-6-phosphate 1-phosphotransferase